MRFQEAFDGWSEGRLPQAEAALLLGQCERSFTRHDGSQLRLHYDALHQLTQVDHMNAQGQVQAISRYRYDAFGRRLAKTHQTIDPEGSPQETPQTPQTHYFGWDGDRLVHTEDASLIRHTVYEPDSFVPLLELQQAKGHKTPTQWLLSEIQADDDPEAMGLGDMPRAQREMLQETLAMVMQPGGKALHGLPVNAETAQLLSASVATLKAAHDASAKAHPVTIRHVLTDHLGTPIALVDANGDKAGQVTWAASYNAWGDVKEEYNPHHIQQPIRFQGQQVDTDTGLHYNRFRYYDPALGQYVTQDPIGILGGTNTFSYVARPTSGIDPLGLNEMQGKINDIRAEGTGVRLGGAKASLGKAEIKGAHGERSVGGGKQNNAATKNSRSLGEVKVGEPCKSNEIAVAPWSRKWFEKKLGIGDGSVKGSASVQGPNISVDPVCVDPGQVANRTAAEAADAVINNNGLMKDAANPGAALSRREAEAGL